MNRLRVLPSLLLAALLVAACEEKRFDPPDREARTAEADAAFTQALFDTVNWDSERQRLFAGNDIYAAHCRRCHGPYGEGGTPYAIERGIDVPSLVQPDWEYAGDVAAVRRRIFIGHPAGMPVWGIGGITPREIDAAAFYVVVQLRDDAPGARP